MGERAIVAVLGPDTVYWYRSQWAGSEETVASVFDTGTPVEELFGAEWRFLESRPFEEATDLFDMLTTDVFYLVGPRSLTVFVPLWFGLGLPEIEAETWGGILVPVASLSALRRCRSVLRHLKGELLDFVINEQLTPTEANSLLGRVYDLVQHVSIQLHREPKIYT